VLSSTHKGRIPLQYSRASPAARPGSPGGGFASDLKYEHGCRVVGDPPELWEIFGIVIARLQLVGDRPDPGRTNALTGLEPGACDL
jgi:hypothetical protein